ncbi:endonuclease/exonuclease/phosphatase family protein [Phenylobacterium sp.]|uniref:endonuclease/exonuclease/phosphatase family protein n=1 Tax=Phenylobacterium sp. TaxID=1871053 RepID=UPI0011FEBA48|nr:endonuclease/exonuclease/phosphatase family protein [Phenylobacterium sp.]THD63270.1 MAG: endonuclease [Phenylobacterium sp.]
MRRAARAPRLRDAAGALALLIAGLAAGLALLAQGGRFSARLDVFSHPAPLYLAAALAAAALALIGAARLRRVGLGLAILGAILSAALILPEFLRDTGPVAAPGAPGQIKVIEFNARRSNQRFQEIADWLASEHPDVVVLEEANTVLADTVLFRMGWRGAAGRIRDSLILTPRPYEAMNRPIVDPRSKLTFVNATYRDAQGPFDVVVTHLVWPGPAQARQRATLHAVLASLPTDRTILAGDFNSTSWSFARRQDDRTFGLVRRDRAFWSWPADVGRAGNTLFPFPLLPIDHLYAGPGWATVSVRRGPPLGSDHYPLVVTLAPVARDGPRPGSPER